MPYEHDNELVTVTVDNIHVTEDARFCEKLETAYLKALAHVSAVEEQFQGSETDPPDGAEEADDARSRDALFDELLDKIMYRLFVGDDNRTPLSSGDGLPITRSPLLKRVA